MKKLEKDPAHNSRKAARRNLAEALEKLVQLYDAWGKPDEAVKWRTELEAHMKAAEAKERLELYIQKKPYRDPALAVDASTRPS